MSSFVVPEPNLQIAFHDRLVSIRNTCLLDALLSYVEKSDIVEVDRELGQLVTGTALQRMAGWGLRGEIVFPVTCILRKNPRLLAYYRLLLGFSQKQFYGSYYGFAPFKVLEEKGRLSSLNATLLPDLCRALCGGAEILVHGVSRLSRQTVHELTLLTLGPQLRGGALNTLGTEAARLVFHLIHSIVRDAIVESNDRSMVIRNAAGRTVCVEFSNDPDICIRETLSSGKLRNHVAMEIKGGRDSSNIHNRIGEAEKSHQKAKKGGYVEFWTLIGVSDLDLSLAHRESPTTNKFFHIPRLIDGKSHEFMEFRENLLARIGIRSRGSRRES